MEEIGNIDIEGKTLAYSPKDLRKLDSSEGCIMKLVTDKVYNLDDGDDSDLCEDEDEEGISSIGLTESAKRERMKKEFISVALNSNKDPVKPGTGLRLTKTFLDEGDEKTERSPEAIAASYDLARGYHKRYEQLGNYEQLITKLDDQGNRLFEEISPDRVYKRRLTPGAGPLITDDSMVIYNCAFWTESATEPYDSTWLRRNTNVSDLANDSLLPGLYELLLTTRRGEWCEAIIKPEAAFGRLGAPPRIPANATIFCVLEVVKVVPKDKVARLDVNPVASQQAGVSFEDFYKASDEARTRGNYFFEQKQYRAALQRYKSGIRILEALTYKNEDEEGKANALLVKLYNNCARAANRLGECRFALAACKQASLIDDREPKTHWNRLSAWKKMGHLDRALGNARRALQLFPDPQVQRTFKIEADELKRRIQHEKCELDDLHRLMSRALLA